MGFWDSVGKVAKSAAESTMSGSVGKKLLENASDDKIMEMVNRIQNRSPYSHDTWMGQQLDGNEEIVMREARKRGLI